MESIPGSNAAGKTATISMISGLLEASRGDAPTWARLEPSASSDSVDTATFLDYDDSGPLSIPISITRRPLPHEKSHD
jgi:ABC-type transport system involved in cytochrome c biogenesis ATPase subunit